VNSRTTSRGAAAARERPPEAEKTRQLLAETAGRLSAHTSVLHATALRLLALEARVAHLQSSADRQPSVTASAPWRGSLPGEPISSTLSAGPSVRLMAIHAVDGNVNLLELCLLATLAKRADACSLFEFGTLDGRTALNLAANAGPKGKVFTLDLRGPQAVSPQLLAGARSEVPTKKHARGFRYKGTLFETSIVQLCRYPAKFNFDPLLGAIDFVYIDGSHIYENVLSDSRIALRLLRNGRGTVAWHGYAPISEGVVRALDELHATEPQFAGMRHIEGTDLAYARVGSVEAGTACE